MRLRKASVFLNGAIGALILSILGMLLFTTATPAGAAQGQTGVSGTAKGVTVTLAELRSRPAPAKFATPRQASPRRTFSGSANPRVAAPSAPAVSPSAAPSAQTGAGEKLPQTPIDEILGLQITNTAGFVPPDTMGAVGPTQFLFSVNDHLRAYNKNSPHTQIFDFDEIAFWGSTADPAGVSDTHVRYDRLSQRWFITEIDVPNGNNHILLAVSSSADLSTATWTQFAIPATGATTATDNGCFADYDTPGIDQNGIYIGENMFGGVAPCGGGYLHTNLYVLQKSSALTSTLHFTSFFNVATGTQGIVTIQGVDSVDSLTTGYAIAVKETESPRQHLNVWQINNPGSTSPTLSAPTAVTISAENGAEGGVLTHNNVVSVAPTRPMDDIDDRLFSAVIRSGHLWTAHNVIVNSSGDSNGSGRNRDAVRWFDINVSGLTLNQSGTVFDSASSGFLEYWMGTVMVSGQGHVAMGLNRANSTTNVQAGALGRLAGDAAGTMRGFSLFQNSTGDAYYDGSFVPNPANRWGDYTYTSLDPCDDMTMWTTQEYVAGSADGGIGWGTAAEKLQAPAPAILPAGPVASVPTGQTNTPLMLVGTSPAGQGFYDTPSSADATCRKRLTAAATNGVVVTGVTYVDPLHVNLILNTFAATAGTATVTLTNPDGQTSATTFTLTAPSARIDSIGIFRPSANSFYLKFKNATGFADITVAFNPAITPAPIVGDWTGAGFDTVGVYDQSNGLFSLCTSNSTANCAIPANVINFVLGNPNDMPLAGRWQAGPTNFGGGVFRPSNGLIYLKNQLTTGFADYTMVLGIPGDVGLAGDWNGDGLDSPGVYRPSNQNFYLNDQVCNCSEFATYTFQYGNPGDYPVTGDWIGQGHDGVGLFRQSNGFTYLRNELTTGFADITFVFGIAGDIPVAGHWQLVYPPIPNPADVLVPPSSAPGQPGSGQPGSNGLGD
ncbi:MAG: hypothetical protein ACYDBJ_23735 [Aggregatilineales bacterium]